MAVLKSRHSPRVMMRVGCGSAVTTQGVPGIGDPRWCVEVKGNHDFAKPSRDNLSGCRLFVVKYPVRTLVNVVTSQEFLFVLQLLKKPLRVMSC